MRRECRERFPHRRLQRKRLVSDPGMHHGTYATQVPWCMSGSQSMRRRGHVPGIPGACATHNFMYRVTCPWLTVLKRNSTVSLTLSRACFLSPYIIHTFTGPDNEMHYVREVSSRLLKIWVHASLVLHRKLFRSWTIVYSQFVKRNQWDN